MTQHCLPNVHGFHTLVRNIFSKRFAASQLFRLTTLIEYLSSAENSVVLTRQPRCHENFIIYQELKTARRILILFKCINCLLSTEILVEIHVDSADKQPFMDHPVELGRLMLCWSRGVHGYGSECCGNTAGMDLAIAGN